jgi:hypothetical protein
MILAGDLTEIDFKTLLSLIETLKATGELIIKNNSSTFVIHFKKGKPVNAEGEKGPVETIDRIICLEKGTFEFKKTDNIQVSQFSEKLSEHISAIDAIKSKCKKIKNIFPNQNFTISLTELKNNDEIKLSAEEWEIISLIKEPIHLYELTKTSPFGELKTLSTILNLKEKNLVQVSKDKDKPMPEDDVVPIKKAGQFAKNTPIYGEKNIEFYKKIDNKKDFITIVNEMGISYKEGRDILRYLLSQGKISLRKTTK